MLYTGQLGTPESQLASIELGALPALSASDAASAGETASLGAAIADAAAALESIGIGLAGADAATITESGLPVSTHLVVGSQAVLALPGSVSTSPGIPGNSGTSVLASGIDSALTAAGTANVSIGITGGVPSWTLPAGSGASAGIPGNAAVAATAGGAVGTAIGANASSGPAPAIPARMDTQLVVFGSP